MPNQTDDPILAEITDRLSARIDAEPDHNKRQKLRAARELVRDVRWGTDTAPRWFGPVQSDPTRDVTVTTTATLGGDITI